MPERRDDHSGDPSHGVSEDSRLTRCIVCDSRVDSAEWHPVTTYIDDEGEFHLQVFCSIDCRNDWQAG